MADEPKPVWTGWLKRRGVKPSRWEAVVSGDRYMETWRKLAMIPERGDRCVMRTGSRPEGDHLAQAGPAPARLAGRRVKVYLE